MAGYTARREGRPFLLEGGRRRLAWKKQGLCRTGRPMWHTAYILMQDGALAQRRCQRLDPRSQAQAVVDTLLG